MSLRPIGGIYWRLDASGNLTSYDSSGNVIAKFVSSKFSGQVNSSQISYSAGYSTTSLTDVSVGAHATFTSQVSTRALVAGYISYANDTANADGNWSVYITTGSDPGQGNQPGGTDVAVVTLAGACPTASRFYEGTVFGFRGSIVVGTQFTFYLTISSHVSGTARISSANIWIIEI
jgi:hypothetical protein